MISRFRTQVVVDGQCLLVTTDSVLVTGLINALTREGITQARIIQRRFSASGARTLILPDHKLHAMVVRLIRKNQRQVWRQV